MSEPQKTDLELLGDSREQVVTLTADLATAQADIVAATDLASQAEQAHQATQATLAQAHLDHAAQLSTAQATVAQAVADLATADTRAETRQREISAAAGGTLPGKTLGAGDHTGSTSKPTHTRESFGTLSPFARADFCRKGGKLVD